MRGFFLTACLTLLTFSAGCVSTPTDIEPNPAPPEWSLVIHGGAGVITKDSMSPDQEAAYTTALNTALDTGTHMLANGESAIDTMEAIIRVLEDDPLFNAGRGAVLTETGTFSLDASIMDGGTLNAGAVASLSNVRHPISAARKVMDVSPHVMLAGDGADQFAAEQGLEIVLPGYFYTERRWESLLKVLEARGLPTPEKPEGISEVQNEIISSDRQNHSFGLSFPDDEKFGTVGVVAMDKNRNIVAGTSTGGTTAKRWGRVGDSPIIGAGTYAKNEVCGISATGTGEYFIRLAVTHSICNRIELAGETAQEAADRVIQTELTQLGGDGGVVFLGPDGEPGWSFNTEGMYRAKATSRGDRSLGIYGTD